MHTKKERLSPNLLDPPHLPAHQAHLNAVRMSGGVGHNILNHTLGEFTALLVRLQYYGNLHTRFDIDALITFHIDSRSMLKMHEYPAEILIVFLQPVIQLFDLWLCQEAQYAFLELA